MPGSTGHVQVAGEAAFGAREELEVVKAGYARNRAVLAETLPALGLPVMPMDGAFYCYVDVTKYTNDSMEFCKKALREASVAMTPGVDFDREEGARGLRISYAGSEADIVESMRRLRQWLAPR